VRFSLEDARAMNETFLVADPTAVTVAELVTMLRTAAGRKPQLIPMPPGVLSAVLSLAGKRDIFDRLAGTLVVQTDKLITAGWQPVTDTRTAISEMVQAASPRKSGTASRSTP
jgi:UDP-glucose 4-epimerase